MPFNRNQARGRGFTLVELLVVIAIIGILIALLLPAVQAAREAARRSQCTNNLKQVGIALHNYHDANKAFPLGHVMANGSAGVLRGSWIKGTLQFMELKSLYDQFNHNADWWDAPNQAVRAVKIPGFMCPSDIDPEIFNTAYDFGFRGNYAGNTGIGTYKRVGRPSEQDGLIVRGPFVHNYSARFSDLADGTSNTAAVTEIRKARGNDSRGALFADAGTVQYTHDGVPNELGMTDITERCAPDPDLPCSSGTSNGPHRLTARSRHSGGVNLLLFDGSVRFVNDSVDRPTWQAAASMDGREALQLP
jgi:prepilin-type N-terminal cleavage/methylation domain-containing protein/prepilin-type processing-associated H-X9-DG protein